MTIEPRPKRYPPPEFPTRRAALFARTPPAIFPSILGLLGLASALRLALGRLGWDQGPGDLIAGLVVALWAFAAVAYVVKVARRPGVVLEDLRVLPGRSGLATLTMGGMVSAGLVGAHSASVGSVLLLVALVGHAVIALLLVRLLLSLAPEARTVNPTLHLTFVGFIVAAGPALALGWEMLTEVLFWAVMPVAATIWALSLRQFVVAPPPSPLRPLLAIHIAPAALLSMVASLLGKPELALAFALLAGTVGGFILVPLRWTAAAGPSPLWGAFTFPLAALATAYLLLEGGLWAGLAVLAVAMVVNPLIAWWVLKRWSGGKLAAMTNAAEA